MKLHRGDIIWMKTNITKGHVQDGTRPVVVISNDVGNACSPVVIVAPMTGIIKKAYMPTHVVIESQGLNCRSMIMTEQIQTIDKRNVCGKVDKLTDEELKLLDDAIRVSLNV